MKRVLLVSSRSVCVAGSSAEECGGLVPERCGRIELRRRWLASPRRCVEPDGVLSERVSREESVAGGVAGDVWPDGVAVSTPALCCRMDRALESVEVLGRWGGPVWFRRRFRGRSELSR